MKSGIYAVVKPHRTNMCYYFHYKSDNHYAIYDKMMEITDNDHEIASDAASWCELAVVGDIYEFREGQIEIVKIE